MSLIAFGLAVLLGFALGAYQGRAGERRAMESGIVKPRGIRPLAFEIELRRAVGARRLHPSPETAGRQAKARIKR